MALLKNVNSYVKNVGKSILFAGVSSINEKVPVINGFIDTNQETIKEWRDSLRNLKSSGKIKDELEKNELFKLGTDILSNTVRDLKTGKWYATDEEENELADAYAKEAGFDFDTDFDMDADLDAAASENSTVSPEVKATATNAKVISNSVIGSGRAISNTVIAGSKYVGDSVNKASKVSYLQNVQAMGIMTTGFTNMTNSIGALADFNSKFLKTHIENSTKYFQSTTKLLNEQNAILKEMLEMQRNLYKNEQDKQKKTKQGRFSKIVDSNGVIDLGGLLDNAKQNAKDALVDLGIPIDNPEMLKILAAHPMQFAAQAIFDSFLGDRMGNTIKDFGRTLSGIAGTTIAKINKSGGKGLFGSLMNMLFKAPVTEKKTVNTAAYNKGAMQYNGLANKSIIEVIPGYLARIEAALTGGPERVFNFDTGKWTTQRNLRYDFIRRKNSNISTAFSDVSDEFSNMIGNYRFTNQEQRDTLREDINKFFAYIYDQGGYVDLKQDSKGRANKNLAKKLKISEKNFNFIVSMYNQLTAPTRLQLAGNVLMAKEDNNNFMSQIDQGQYVSYQGLFNNRYGGQSLPDLDNSKMSKYDKSIKYKYREDINPTTNIAKILLGIYDEVAMTRIYTAAMDGTRRRTHNSLVKRRKALKFSRNNVDSNSYSNINENTSGNIKNMLAKLHRERGFDDSYISDVDINSTDFIYDGSISERTDAKGYYDTNDPNDVSSLAEDVMKNGAGFRDRYRNELIGAENEYAQYKGSDIFEKLHNAEGFSEKLDVMSAFMAQLREKPARFLEDIVSKVDEAIYSVFYTRTRVDENGKKITGFFNNLLYDVRDTFNKVGDMFSEFVIDPFAKTITDMKNSEFGKKFTGAVKGNLQNMLGGVSGAFSNVFGGVYRYFGEKDRQRRQAEQQKREAYAYEDVNKNKNDEAWELEGAFATGNPYVPKTGLYALSKGEMVIPSTMNPYNPYKTSIKQDRKNENAIIRKATSGLGNVPILGQYAEGTGTKKSDTEKRVEETFGSAVIKAFPDAAGAGVAGGIAGLVTLGPLGMLGGMILGAGSSLAKNVNGVSEFLFGKDTENGEHKEGLLDGETFKYIKKFWPDVKNFGIVGGTGGLLADVLFDSPVGLVGGALLGGAFGFLKKNDDVRHSLFGDDVDFKLPKKLDDYLKKHMGRNIIGMVGGGLAGAATVGGPLGLAGGMIVGGSLSYFTTTQKFEDAILGKKDKDGKRTGGVLGNIRKYIIDPLSKRAISARKSFEKYLKSEIFEPLKAGIRPMFKLTSNVITRVARTVGRVVTKAFKSGGMKLFGNKIVGRFLKSKYGGAMLGGLAGAATIGGPLGIVAGTVGLALARTEMGKKITNSIVKFIPNAVNKVGNWSQAQLIKRGWETDMTASQQLDFMSKYNHGKNFKNKGYLELLRNSDANSLQKIEKNLRLYKEGSEGAKKMLKEFDDNVVDNLNKFRLNYKDSKKIRALIKTPIKSEEDRVKFIGTLESILRNQTPNPLTRWNRYDLTTEEEQAIMNYCLTQNSIYQNLINAVGDSDKARANIEKEFKDSFGVDLKKSNIDDMIKQSRTEFKSKENKQEQDPIKNANKNTDKVLKVMTTNNAISLGILKAVSGTLSKRDFDKINAALAESDQVLSIGGNKLSGTAILDSEGKATGKINIGDYKSADQKKQYDRNDKYLDWYNNKQFDDRTVYRYTQNLNSDTTALFNGVDVKNNQAARNVIAKLANASHVMRGKETLATSVAKARNLYSMEELDSLMNDSSYDLNKKKQIGRFSEIIRVLAKYGLKATAEELQIIKLENSWSQIKNILEKYVEPGKLRLSGSSIEWFIKHSGRELKDANKYCLKRYTDLVYLTPSAIDSLMSWNGRDDGYPKRKLLDYVSNKSTQKAISTLNAEDKVNRILQGMINGTINAETAEAAVKMILAGGAPYDPSKRTVTANDTDSYDAAASAASSAMAISGAASGSKYIPKTGLYALSRGEMVVPSTRNPYNPYKTSIAQDKKNENSVISKFRSGMGRLLGRYAEGTDGATAEAATDSKEFTTDETIQDGKKMNVTNSGRTVAEDTKAEADAERKEKKETAIKLDIKNSLHTIADALKKSGSVAVSKTKDLAKGGGLLGSIASLITMPFALAKNLLGSVLGILNLPFKLLGIDKFVSKGVSKLGSKVKQWGMNKIKSKFKGKGSAISKYLKGKTKGKFGKIAMGLGLAAGIGGGISEASDMFFGGDDSSEDSSNSGFGLSDLALYSSPLLMVGSKLGSGLKSILGGDDEEDEDFIPDTPTKETAENKKVAKDMAAEKGKNLPSTKDPAERSMMKGIKTKIVNALKKLGTMVSKYAIGPAKFLAEGFNKFAKFIVRKFADPKNLMRMAKRAMKKAGFTAAQAVAGVSTLGIGALVLTVGELGTWFMDGWSKAGEYFKSDDPTITMHVVAGVIDAILGTTPLGYIIDAGDVIGAAKSIFGISTNKDTSDSELDSEKPSGKEEDLGPDYEDSAKPGNSSYTTTNNAKPSTSTTPTVKYSDVRKGHEFEDLAAKPSGNTSSTMGVVNDYLNNKQNEPMDSGRTGNAAMGKWGRGLPGQFNSQLDPANAMNFNIPGDSYSQSMYDSGCGPVAAANAASALGIGVDPKIGAQYALNKGYKETNGGTRPGFFSDFLGQYGIGTRDISGSTQSIKSTLASGNPVILMGHDNAGISSNNPYGKGIHYVTATGLDGKGNIIVQDPESNTPNKVYRTDDVLSKSSIAIATGMGKFGRGLKFSFGRSKRPTFRFGRAAAGDADYPQQIWDFLMSKNIGSQTVAAIMGNIYAESGYNPTAQNPSSKAYGICQWLGSRLNNLDAMAKAMKLPRSDINVQLQHLWVELDKDGEEHQALIDTQNASTLEDATRAFCYAFERPSKAEAESSMGKRIAAAKEAFQKQGKGINVAATYTDGGDSGSSSDSGVASDSLFGMLSNISSALDISSIFGMGKYGREAKTEQTNQSNSQPTSAFEAIGNVAKTIGTHMAGAFANYAPTVAKVGKAVFGSAMKTIFGRDDLFGGKNTVKNSSSSSSTGGTLTRAKGAPPPKGSALEYMLSNMNGATITEEYGVNRGSYVHAGTDIGVDNGTPVPSPVNGTVVDVNTQPEGFGKFVQVKDKNGNFHIFPHLSAYGDDIKIGANVKKGQIVAYAGSSGHSTGPHLHYEIDPPSNFGAETRKPHIDPSTYDVSGLGKTMQRINANNAAANKLTGKKYLKTIPLFSDGPNSGKGKYGRAVQAVSNAIDYTDKFDAIISLLSTIASALTNGGGVGSPALATPTAQFGGATNLGESFSRMPIESIINSMNSIASKNKDNKNGI